MYLVAMDLGESVTATGTSFPRPRFGKMRPIAVYLAIQEYIFSNKPDNVFKRTGPNDLVDWNDLCKSPSFTETQCGF